MNHFFEGSIANKLKDENISLTVFKKKEEGWEKLLDPFYSSETKNIPRIETWRNTTTISLALNSPIGDNKTCKVTKMENGTYNGPTQVGNFKWEVEMTSKKESYNDPNASIEIEVADKE